MEGIVEFNADDEPAAFHADRFRDVDGRSVLTPFSGAFTRWKTLDGRCFPTHREATQGILSRRH
jgi:hypothetical protein